MMRFKVGDKVKFLNEKGTGKVMAIVSDNLVMVLNEDGFEIPFPSAELIPESTAAYELNNRVADERKREFRPESTAPLSHPRLQVNLDGKAVKDVCLAFVPVNEATMHLSDLNLYLVNDSDYVLFYRIGTKEEISFRYLVHGYLEANTKLLLKRFAQSDISKVKTLHLQVVYLSSGLYMPVSPADVFFDMGTVRFYKESFYKENDFFESRAILFFYPEKSPEPGDYRMDSKTLAVVIEEKEKVKEQQPKKIEKSDMVEIDLHIHALVEDYSSLTPTDILKKQMDRFYLEIERGLAERLKKIVFIHGVGNGTLKSEIIKELKTKFSHFEYQDASFKEYGYGATLVYLRQRQ